MTPALRALRTRVLGLLALTSMYLLVVIALSILFIYAVALSFTGTLAFAAIELVASAAAIAAGAFAIDLLTHRLTNTALRWESTLITVLILVFVMRPSDDPMELVWLTVTGAVASASKMVLAWRGRHVFNPAAAAASVMTITGVSPAAWWVGTPILAAVVAVLGIAIAWRTEKLRVVLTFIVLAWAISIATTLTAYAQAGLAVSAVDISVQLLISSPILFLGFFMLTEPLTLPSRFWQQLLVAAVVAFFVGYPLSVGVISLSADRALMIGNIVAFVLAVRSRNLGRLTLTDTREVTPRIRELTFAAEPGSSFVPGQYLELTVPHKGADIRGTRREFSLVSAPAELPHVRIAYRVSPAERGSTFKRALEQAQPGDRLRGSGIWGDFTLPASGPLLFVAAGIGITPFVSHARELSTRGVHRDIVVVYVASSAAELAYHADFADHRVIIVTPDDPTPLGNETWAGGERLSAPSLASLVPDLATRHALISGPPALIADLQPALARAASVKTDAFAGY